MNAYRPQAYMGRAYALPDLGGGSGGGGADEYFANVKLLLHGDGTNNGTVFTDSSAGGKSPTVVGNIKTVTAQSVFGGSSIYFDGAGDRLTYANHKDFAMGAEDFTVEFRWMPDTANDSTLFLVAEDTIATADKYSFGIRHNGVSNSGKIQFFGYWGTTAVFNISSTTGWNASTWKAVRCIHAGNVFGIMIDGVLEVSATPTLQSLNFNSDMKAYIGMQEAAAIPAKGWMDEFRLTKSVARSSGNYSVDGAAFPDS